jgi:hypothetical protein
MSKKIACCYNCVFAYLDREITLWCFTKGFLNWPACANHPQSYGRMKRTPRCGICPNYRPEPETPEGDVRQIPLGDGFYAYVDAKDYEWLSRWTWSMIGAYAGRYENGKQILMHRAIVKPPRGKIVDHKNRNKLDNTRDNLRVCTHAQNAYNRHKRRGSASRFKGVGRRKKDNKFYACVYCRGDQFYLGVFANELDAARAHDAKAVELFGEFALLNFPEEWPPERRAEVYAMRPAEGVERKRRKPARKTHNASRPTRKAGRPRTPRRGDARVARAGRGRTTEDRGRRAAKKKKNSRAKTRRRGEGRRTRERTIRHKAVKQAS